MTTTAPFLKALKLAALALATLMLASGCGFQLRGTSPGRDHLPLRGGQVAASAAQANYILRLQDYRQDRRASTTTAPAAAAEYVLRHTLAIERLTAHRIPLIASTDLTASETYRYDETSV